MSTVSPPRPVQVQIGGFLRLEVLHKLWAKAGQELEGYLRVPICVERCGLCCEVNTPIAWQIEVDYAISWLLGQADASLREQVLQRVRWWLEETRLETHPRFRGLRVEKPQIGPRLQLSREEYKALAPELLATTGGCCPLLTADKRCLVYPVRPLACRAYGVTRQPGYECPRLEGRGESSDVRAYIGGPAAQLMQQQVQQLLGSLQDVPRLALWGLFPTGIYRVLRNREFRRIAKRVPTVKLTQGSVSGAMLFDTQDQERQRTGSFSAFTPYGEVTMVGLDDERARTALPH